jgi:AraC family transcriptional regulator
MNTQDQAAALESLYREHAPGHLQACKVFDSPAPRVPREQPLCDRSWMAVERYLEVNLGIAVRLRDMAQVACTSRFHFARRFRARTGMSPMEYVREKRIERAKEALARGGYTICAIAHELGFQDQSHFCRTFSRKVGLTPREFRLNVSRLCQED